MVIITKNRIESRFTTNRTSRTSGVKAQCIFELVLRPPDSHLRAQCNQRENLRWRAVPHQPMWSSHRLSRRSVTP